MKVLFIGDVFEEKYETYVNQAAKANVEYSSVLFQRKMLNGFSANGIDVTVLSAPAIGAYPQRSNLMFCKSFAENSHFRYVDYCNIWGYRNLSQEHALKEAVCRFLKENSEDQILIYVYSAHNPFIAAARYAKLLRPDIRLCLVVPDLPQYMNLESNRSKVYDILKSIDNRAIKYNSKSIDTFLLLTEPMREKLKVGDRPCMVQEGIIEDIPVNREYLQKGPTKNIVYTGKLYKQFGILTLVNTFMNIDDPELRLIICGTGDAKNYVKKCADIDSRIEYKGLVSPEEAAEFVRLADVLVNPRMNDNEYTKYSFPSKNLEYLMSGRPVVACMLDGIPPVYRDFMYCFSNAEDLEDAIRSAIDSSEQNEKYQKFLNYASKNLTAASVVARMVQLLSD